MAIALLRQLSPRRTPRPGPTRHGRFAGRGRWLTARARSRRSGRAIWGLVCVALFACSWILGMPGAALLHATLSHGGFQAGFVASANVHDHEEMPHDAGDCDAEGDQSSRQTSSCGARHTTDRGHTVHDDAAHSDHGHSLSVAHHGDGPEPDQEDDRRGCARCRELLFGKLIGTSLRVDALAFAGFTGDFIELDPIDPLTVATRRVRTTRGPPCC